MCHRASRPRCESSLPATAARPTTVDAYSVAMVALHGTGLLEVAIDEELVVFGMLADRCDELGRARTQAANRLHRLLLELFPGGAQRSLLAKQARDMVHHPPP